MTIEELKTLVELDLGDSADGLNNITREKLLEAAQRVGWEVRKAPSLDEANDIMNRFFPSLLKLEQGRILRNWEDKIERPVNGEQLNFLKEAVVAQKYERRMIRSRRRRRELDVHPEVISRLEIEERRRELERANR